MARALETFEHYAAARLVEERDAIARDWVTHIAAEANVLPRRVLPTDALLGALPAVLARVAEFVGTADERAICDDAEVVEALRGLAGWRQRQGHDARELLRELDLLARVLDGACLRWLGGYPRTPSPDAVVRVAGRLNRAPILIAEITVGAFLELERAERSHLLEQLGTFTDMLVHELKTPLGAAEAAALLLENDGMVTTEQDRRRFAALIQRNLRRACTLVDDARCLAGARKPGTGDARRLPLRQVLAAVLAELRERAAAERVRLEVVEPVPAVRVDAARLELVLLNLVGNAVKYSDPDREDRWARLRFERREEGAGGWALEVSDNGLGIPEEHRDHVFVRSFRAHPHRADGMGLGLAMVREAVRQLGGSIHVDSEPGLGSTFRVWLPAEAEEQA